ncbi:MAG: hypothetical protein ABIR77_02575, partial [Sphingomicrobium sp.]
MNRIFQLGLLLLVLTGFTSQPIAHAMTYGRMVTPMQMSSGSMSCDDEAGHREAGKLPCNKVGLQCLNAIGCPAMTLAEPTNATDTPAKIASLKSVPGVA